MFRSVDTHLLLSHLKHTPLNRQSFHYFNFYVRITALIHWRSPQFCQDSISHFFLLLLLVHNKQCLDVSLTPTSNCSISISFRFIHTHTHCDSISIFGVSLLRTLDVSFNLYLFQFRIFMPVKNGRCARTMHTSPRHISIWHGPNRS